MPIISLGGIGVISVLSNIFPNYTHNIVQNYFNGNIDISTKMQLDALPLINTLFSEVNPIPIKSALNYCGFDFGIPRLPLTKMNKSKEDILKDEIKKFKIYLTDNN